MNRREFTKTAIALPAVAALPATTMAKTDPLAVVRAAVEAWRPSDPRHTVKAVSVERIPADDHSAKPGIRYKVTLEIDGNEFCLAREFGQWIFKAVERLPEEIDNLVEIELTTSYEWAMQHRPTWTVATA